MSRQPFSNADFALLRFDSTENWMINSALIVLETRICYDELLRVLQGSMLTHNRFRQRVVRPFFPRGRAFWEDDGTFDLRHHVTPIRTPLPADRSLLEDIISRLMSVGLDQSVPLWQIYFIEKYGEASALLLRVHHSIADGASLVKVLLSMTSEEPGLAGEFSAPAMEQEYATNGRKNGTEPATMQVLGKLSAIGIRLLGDAEAFHDVARLANSAASALKDLVLNPPEPPNTFRGRVGQAKKATWSPAVPLELIRQIGKGYNSTINDVLLCAVTGALRQYIFQLDVNAIPPKIHTLVPVDMRRDYRIEPIRLISGAEFQEELGNQVGATLLKLPLDIEDPVERLEAVHQSMDLLKASGESLATYGLMGFMGIVPPAIQDLASRFWLSKSSAVMTNVVGPNQQLYLGNAAIDTVIGWVPMFGPLGLGVSFFSYNKKIWFGIAADQGLIPDPEKIVNYFMEEIDKLKRTN